jgi:hypothetical protein
MSCELGCAAAYTVQVVERGGTTAVTPPLDFTSLRWSRTLDATSDARVVIDVAEAPDCCQQLEDVHDWRHELLIYRDQERVWEGPISSIDPSSSGEIVINAHDVTVWLWMRVIHNRLCFAGSCGGGNPDLSTIAEAIVRDALEPDDPNVLPYLVVMPSGEHGERIYEPLSGYAIDDLDELARTAIDYTALGRSIIIGGPLTFGQLSQLTCDDFASDVATIEDGLAAATRGIVRGDGVVGTYGGIDPYYGLLERFVEAKDIKDAASARYAATQLVAGANPPPVYVLPPSNSELAATAPVCINELVPGVLVPIAVDCTCRPVSSVMRLAAVKVEFDADGERVRPAFVPAPMLPAGGFEEVPGATA